MGSPYYTWDSAVEAAMKILGKKGKIPDKFNQEKHRAGLVKCYQEYNAAFDALQSKIQAFRTLIATRKTAIKQGSDAISKSNMGLDPKNDDDKEKIEKAQELMNEFINGATGPADDMIKWLDKLDPPMKILEGFKAVGP
jgi:hypothetical protein